MRRPHLSGQRLAYVTLAALGVVLDAVAPSRMSAQTFAGEVVEATIAQPLRGYPVRLVKLTDATPRLCDSTSTDERGLFQLGGQGAGRYALQFGPEGTFLETRILMDSMPADTTIERRFSLVTVNASGDPNAPASKTYVEVKNQHLPLRLRYPKDMLGMKIQGDGTVRFVIDQSGHAVLGTVYFVRDIHPSFKRAVLEAIRLMTWDPATVSGVKVPRLIEVPFAFSLARS
jgi:hypothetical protein